MTSPKLLPILSAGFAVAVLATCSAATAQQTPADREDAALAYAQCMRDNGYAEFPDPTPEGGIRFLINPESAPRFHKAAAACQQLAPEGMRDEEISPENLEGLVKLAQCMRENGVPEFPDPTADGRFELRGISSGLDDPQIEAAMDVCRDQAGLGAGGRILIGG
jgi:hypothetical protein